LHMGNQKHGYSQLMHVIQGWNFIQWCGSIIPCQDWASHTPKFHVLGGIKYTKSTVRNQSIIQKSFSSLLHAKWCLMSNQQVIKMVDF
jgi:hypothetical protein